MYQKPIPLRLIFVITFVLQTVAAVSLTMWLFWNNGQRSIRELNGYLQTETLVRIQEKLNHYLESSATINRLNIASLANRELTLADPPLLMRQFWKQRRLLVAVPVTAIYFGQADGQFVGLGVQGDRTWQVSRVGPQTNRQVYTYVLDPQGQPQALRQKGALYEVKTQPWYTRALQSKRPSSSAVYQDFKEVRPQLTLSEAVYDANQTLVGVVGVDVSLTQISEYLRSLVTQRMPTLLIVDRDGQLVATSTQPQLFSVSPDKRAPIKATDLNDALVQASIPKLRVATQQWDAIQDAQNQAFWFQGRLYSLWASPLRDARGLDLLVVALVPQPTFLGQMPAHSRETLLLCFVVLLTAVLLGLITARRLSQGLQQFIQSGQAIVDGALDQTFPNSRIDELSKLAQTFNQMAHHLRASFEELEARVQERTAALKESEEKFAKVFFSHPNPIAISRPTDGCFVEANESATRLFGFGRDAIIGKTSFDLGINIDGKHCPEIIQQIQAQGPIRSVESRLATPAGERIILYSADLIEVDGKSYLMSIVDDITDRKRAEEALRRSEEKFVNFFHANPNPMAISRMDDGYIIEVNASALAFFGAQPAEVIGQTSFDLNLWVEVAERERITQKLQQAQTVRGFECLLRTQSGQIRTVLYSAELVDVDGQPCLISTINDISDRRQAEEALEQAKVEAEAANQAKSTFLSHMSHELRTPLNAILGFTQVMSRDKSLSHTQREQLDIINRSGEHLLEMINDVLDLAKIEAGRVDIHRTSVDLYRLLETLDRMFQMKAAAKKVPLVFERSPQVPQFIETDAGKLRQILINLIGNAIKFTDTGHILVKVRWIERKGKADFPRLSFEVRDTGTGIAPSEQSKIFEAFVQSQVGRSPHDGTGLGLSISREFIRLLGGEISVSSTLGEGTRFSFHLPVEVSTPPNASAILSDEQFRSNPLWMEPLPNNTCIIKHLKLMPIQWIQQVHQAALAVNNPELWQLIGQIPAEHETLKNTLSHLVQNFRCDLIFEMTEPLL
jgi:PAS domain S-box-containing protein